MEKAGGGGGRSGDHDPVEEARGPEVHPPPLSLPRLFTLVSRKPTPFSPSASTSRATRRPMPPLGARNVGPAGGLAPREGEQEAAAPAGRRVQLGRDRLGREVGRVAGVDAAEQRVDQPLGHLAPEPGADQVGHREVGRPGGRGQHQVQAGPEDAGRATGARERRTGRIRPGTPRVSPSGRARSRPPTQSMARPASGATSSVVDAELLAQARRRRAPGR